jgi:hypothetical protein
LSCARNTANFLPDNLITQSGTIQAKGAGQESDNELYNAVSALRDNVHLIGGAELATEIDAKRAIDQGFRLAAAI